MTPGPPSPARDGMDADDKRWTLTVARHQEPLDAALLALTRDAPPGAVVVVVRSRETEDRLRRLLPFPTQVVRLAEFLGAVAAVPTAPEDLLPQEVLHGHLVDALPPSLKDARDALADEHLSAIQTLATNGIRPPYPGPAGDGAEDLLETGHRALLQALTRHNANGRYAPFQRVLLAHDGTPRPFERFPGLEAVVLTGIDWLSPAEELALERVLQDRVHVHVHAVGRPPRSRDAPTEGPDGPHARWAALAHTDRLVRWAAHWCTERHTDLHETTPRSHRVARLDPLFSLHPHPVRPLHDVHILTPPDPETEVLDAAARIRDLLDSATCRPEEIAVIVPRLERYAGPLADAFDAHGIPHTIRHGPPLATTAAGSLLRLILADLDHAHERDRFLDLVAHPLFRWTHTTTDGQTHTILAPWLGKILARRGLTPRGAGGWRRAFDRLEESRGDILGGPTPAPTGDEADDEAAPEAAEETFFSTQRDAALHLIERLDRLASAPDSEAFFSGLRTLLQHAGVGRGVRHAMRHSDDPRALTRSFDAVLDLLDETQRAYRMRPQRVPSRHVREALVRRLHATPLPVTTDRTWGVQVLGLRNAAGVRYRHVHLLGATADDLPPPPSPRRLERLLERRLGPERLRRLDPDLEARRILHGLLADTDGPVHLSAPRQVEGTPKAASVLIQELQDAFDLEPPIPIEARPRTLRSLQQEAGRTGATWTGAPAQLPAARALLAARSDPADTGPYTGHLVDPSVRAQVADRSLSGGAAVSATRLNRYARCPQHALWADLARLRGDEERDADVSPLDKGTIVHTIIDRWSRDLIERNGKPARIEDPGGEERRLGIIATDVLDGIRIEGLAWQAYQEELLGGLGGTHPFVGRPRGLLKRFLDDMVSNDVAVVGSEVPFGTHERPFEITYGDMRVPLHGTIDRIQVQDGGLQVLDLKTGRPPRRDDTLGGIDLQVPLYVLAARAIEPDRPVALGGYYQLRRARAKEVGLAESIPGKREAPEVLADLVEKTPRRIAEIVAAERAGHHPLTLLDERDAKCQWCDHRLLCGRRPHLTPRRREAARQLGDAWGYFADRIDDLMTTPPDGPDEGGDT